MKFAIYQINFTDEQVDEINDNDGNLGYYLDYLDTLCMPSEENIKTAWDQYKHVATIEAQNLDQVFEIGNIGPEHAIDRRGPMHSISVGDVIIDEFHAVSYFVDKFGFKQFAPPAGR